MLDALIADRAKNEAAYIIKCTKNAVASLSDEPLQVSACMTTQELKEEIRAGKDTDLACIDITAEEALPLTEEFRRGHEGTYLVLIANMRISPVKYMRPSIHAEALLLRLEGGMSKKAIQETMTEAVTNVLARYEHPDTDEVYAIDSPDGRRLIPLSSILFFEARDKKIFLNTGSDEYGFYETMGNLQEQMGERFVRCHRSYLVNRAKIERALPAENLLVLNEGSMISVSRSYKSVLKGW